MLLRATMMKQSFSTAKKAIIKYGRSYVSHLKVTMAEETPATCDTFVWSPFDIFEEHKDTPLALLILNQPISSWETFTCLWKKAAFKVCVDGGTNRCFQLSTAMSVKEDYVPDVISGDMDSALPDVVEFYREKGAELISTPDQDATDFTKALHVAVSTLDKNRVVAFVALVEMTGRLDHIFGIINTLLLSTQLLQKTPLYVVSHDSITWLLEPGYHNINLPREAIETWCGLVPVGEPCRHVTTTGLKWNLRDQTLQFGGLVSTSNAFSNANVTIQTDRPLLYMMGIPETFIAANKSIR